MKKFFRGLLIFTAAGWVVYSSAAIVWNAGRSFELFQKSRWNYSQRRADFKEARMALGLSRFEAVSPVREAPHDLAGVAARYFSFPRWFIRDGEPVRKDDSGGTGVPARAAPLSRSAGDAIHAKRGGAVVIQSVPVKDLPFFATACYALLFLVYQITAGALLLALLQICPEPGRRWWWAAMSYLLGYLTSTVILWLAMAAGARLDRGLVLLTDSSLLVFLLAAAGLAWRPQFGRGEPCRRSGPWRLDRQVLWAVLLGMVTVSVFMITVFKPVTDWDAMFHWILKSKIFFYTQQLRFDLTHNTYYPLLWPLQVAAQFAFAGGMFDQLAQWLSAWFFLAFVVMLWQSIRLAGAAPAVASLLTMVFLGVTFRVGVEGPGLFPNYTSANAENIFLAYGAALLLSLLTWLKARRPRDLLLAALLGLGLSLSKLEGGCAVIFMAVSLWLRARPLRLTPREFVFLILFTLSGFAVLPWAGWINAHGYGLPLMHVQEGVTLNKAGLLFSRILLLAVKNKMIFILSAVLLYVFLRRETRPWTNAERFLRDSAVLLIFFSVMAVLGWPLKEIQTNALDTVARLFLHAAPFVVVLFASRISGQEGGGCEPRV